MEPFNWICPYCNSKQTVVERQTSEGLGDLRIREQKEGPILLNYFAIGCSNPDCKKTTVHIAVHSTFPNQYPPRIDGRSPPLLSLRLMPQGSAKPQPDYIPEAIREDYNEACLIRDLSPKASATLIRRCLQGMIRDFAGISKARLIDEIKALRQSVEDGTADRSITPETVDAIDHVRGIGNIGAHMEKDIDHIVPVDPEEAGVLIELVEMLFEEWYVARETRRNRLDRISQIAGEKKALIADLKLSASE